ncbi:MAG TPA: low specificity L-threonine aldolase [Prolixibacteraceae bacterium]|nr:low specificity L-threonine aldolase [Prolixibacteraceae bacterium]
MTNITGYVMGKGFASDNNAGIHPEILKAIADANGEHVTGYGNDAYTDKAVGLFREHFGGDTEVSFVFNGTGANVVGLSALTRSYHAVICAETAHIQMDECGAPEKFLGCKLLPVASGNGKLTPESVARYLHGFDFEHHAQPRVISISQVTEMGTVYTPEEIRSLADLAHHHGMYLHLDGARISNAAVSLGLPFRAFTRDCGVDVVSFGGTKNGMMLGEAVLIFDPAMAREIKYLRKQSMQLFSKMRFVSAQFIAYLEKEIWKKNAEHANKMAVLLEQEIRKIPQIRITQKVEANGVFAVVPRHIIQPLQEKFFFYLWNEELPEVRWMTSFDTTESEIRDFAALIRSLL